MAGRSQESAVGVCLHVAGAAGSELGAGGDDEVEEGVEGCHVVLSGLLCGLALRSDPQGGI